MLMDNFINNKNIVSYDASKTWIEQKDKDFFFYKRMSDYEYSNQKLMKEKLNEKYVSINGEQYAIDCPNVISITDGVACMDFIDGINLELLLRNVGTHKEGVEILKQLLSFFIENKIYWVDFAPRNILICDRQIIIVDFEKGILDESTELIEYLRNHVYEEYNLFLLPDERTLNDLDVFTSKSKKEILVSSISSSRHKRIAELLGYTGKISYQIYLNILKMVVDVEIPYYEGSEIIYPGVELDKLICENADDNPIDIYSREVIKLYKHRYK